MIALPQAPGRRPAARVDPGISDSAATRLEQNARIITGLVALAHRRAAGGRYLSALEWCRVAAAFAMTNATGRLRDDRLERVIDLVAANALPPSPSWRPSTEGRRVLHVLTEAATVGGLTRLAARWIRYDAQSISSVVVTRQSAVPEHLADAGRASGGTVDALGGLDAVSRAVRLRELAARADMVVCHLQPDDPIAATAFGAGYAGAPVAVYNHADHLFWIAPTSASLVVDFRRAGRELTHRGRGYLAEDTFLLPLLVPAPSPGRAREQTRTALGIGEDQILLVTVARAIKFQDTRIRPRFADLAATALEADPRIVVCAVGPHPEDAPWPELSARFPGRLRVTGPVADPQAFLDAGDVYLDPFPFSSLTSLLEASAAALPVLTLDAHGGLRRALGIADFVASPFDRPVSLDELDTRIAELAAYPHIRGVAGARARAHVESLAAETDWADLLEQLYQRMRTVPGRTLTVAPAPDPDDALRDYGAALLAVEQQIPLLWTVSGALAELDRRDRAEWRVRVTAARIVQKASGPSSRVARLLLGGGARRDA
ncbi:glycosyltransferase family protein [Microbacterium caowuchunii]|uniref:Glycosyltransferase family 4 protein n=1 Tax=Microbacterium caowuchunii TaxID=2614638 RepID=A0A5N0TMP3_9MICO|nr:glycosyltransferase [Microbacterium caowuchunii]KAA9135538.1 glycosyltransferase family 4 protein [Microbacterium caowuchunii]